VAAFSLLGNAKTKPTVTEATSWAETILRAAQAYGPTLEDSMVIQVAQTLVTKENLKDLALEYARKAEKSLTDKVPAESHLRVLKVLATALRNSNETDELRDVDARIAKLDAIVTPPASRISPAGDPSDPKLALKPDQVAIEYIAHACFRIHSATGTRILIDPYASRAWLGYDFPQELAADAVLITHPHYDHDAGQFIGRKAPWTPEVRVLREPGADTVGDIRVTGLRGKHADPWGKEFGQRNTIWLLEVASLRIAHLGDNGPLTKAHVQELGRVDILMMPIDAQYHILKEQEIREIRSALRPRVLIPMHYRIPDLEASQDSPADLGPIDPWLAKEKNAIRLKNNQTIFTAASLPLAEQIIIFHHSPRVRAAQRQ
jgi:L-ascorbate metabolism protein UlaG (beta-lactamase superfamily)